MKKKEEKILFLTDIPPCKNYTGGIMLSQLIDFLLEEKHQVSCFCVMNKNLSPKINESIVSDINLLMYAKPCEDSNNKQYNSKKYYSIIKRLSKILINYITKNNITTIICIIQGEVILSLADYIRKQAKTDYVVQIWDPIEWWMKEHNFDKNRQARVLKIYDKVLSSASYCITTSEAMNKYFYAKYKIKCINVMPPMNVYNKTTFYKPKEKSPFIISMAGQVYAYKALLALLDALEKMKWRYNGREIIFNYYGTWSYDEQIDTKKYIKNGANLVLNGFVQQELLLEELSKSDLLYCPYFFQIDPVYKKVCELSFPSKLVTYMSLNVPTLLHSPNYSSPYKFLKAKNATYNLCSIKQNEMINILQKIMSAKEIEKKEIIANANEIIKNNFSSKTVKAQFFKAIGLGLEEKSKLKILEVNNVDLPGRRFNGFDLQKMINDTTIHSAKQIVTYKTSNDKNVLKFYKTNECIDKECRLNLAESELLSVHSQLSFTSNILKNNDYFARADVVHYHLIHNSKLSLYKMIDLCKSKPSIITIHDPWMFTGRCVHPQNCSKWLRGCKNCEFLDSLFPLKEDNCASLWELKKLVYENIDVDFVVTSEFMLNMFKSSPLTKEQKNIHLIPFGIDLTKFSNSISKEKAKRFFGIKSDDIVLFFRAQSVLKGTNYIVDALKKLETNKKVTILTCSEKGLVNDLKDRYKVIDLGNIDDEKMIMAYNACDMFLMPSTGESFGLMAVEAMACSRPVIIFNNTALPYVTFAPQCGVLVEDKNSNDLAEKIKFLIDNKDEREKRGKLGRNLAEDNYDINKYNEQMLSLYEKVHERQLNKRIDLFDTSFINYNSVDVQKLIKTLKEVYFKVFGDHNYSTYIKDCENDKKINLDSKINYADKSVQNLLDQFNGFIFQELEKENKTKNYKLIDLESSFFKNLRTNRELIIQEVKEKLKSHPFLYFLARQFYLILRKIKRLLFKNKYKSLVARFDDYIYYQQKELADLENKIDTQGRLLADLQIKIDTQNKQISNLKRNIKK